ncbi:MAG: primosomal protein N' [Eubacteriales bacterium]|nr:primosomal protein N' [Eubacteriales bacterium]
MSYARVIIDISVESLDRPFTYSVPPELSKLVTIGTRVDVPFGASKRTGYVIGLSEDTDFDKEKIKDITGVKKGAMNADSVLIKIAAFMAHEYGSTFNQALQTTLPVKKTVRKNKRRTDPTKRMEELGFTIKDDERLTPDQERVFREITETDKPSLLFGITGSGKTRVYIELLRKVIAAGGQAIVLIPEISLTYQTVSELKSHLGDEVAVMHSKLSEGERYEQLMKAANGEISVMVGPRSALFTPFESLKLIIIDEEHEKAYQSDTTPRYDARDIALMRANMCGAKLVLGSATPSVESFKRALDGEYALSELKVRAVPGSSLPGVHIVDLREELSDGNKNIFSRKLYELINDRLDKNEQVMLFLNRRGYAGFVSCRACGYVIKCDHCSVSMTVHNDWYYENNVRKAATLSCHYCGKMMAMPAKCPACGSKYVAPFGTGTQKLELETKRMFPRARVLRMDADTTKNKDGHEKILSAFKNGEADILIGTQMIVKGHDFPKVTLVGIVAADQSINIPDYTAAERTFQLVTQASGRAGRSSRPGDVVIQTYEPEHYSISMAAAGNYRDFYEREMSFRRLMQYPPVSSLLTMRFSGEDEALLTEAAEKAAEFAKSEGLKNGVMVIGPCNAGIYKVNDIFRKVIYLKSPDRERVLALRDRITEYTLSGYGSRKIFINVDLK